MSAPEDGDLVERVAEALGAAPGAPAGQLAPPERERRALILRLARDVAHASERQNAPLAAYLVGRYVEARRAAGGSEAQALGDAARIIDRVTGARTAGGP